MENITYILGAGASYNTVPVVNLIGSCLEIYKEYLEIIIKDRETNTINLNIKHHLKVLNEIIEEEKRHYSIDTYARKLFLKGGDSIVKYKDLKITLACFFHFIQCKREYSFSKYRITSNLLKKHEHLKNIILGEVVDKRYDSFFATILKKDENDILRLPENINIISWNYDFQIELAFAEYLSDKNPSNRLYEQIRLSPNTKMEFYEGAKILKLNGTASLGKKGEMLFRSFGANNIESHQGIYDFFGEIPQTEPLLSFAWEQQDFQVQLIKRAKEIIKQSNKIVVIGYSFPDFNRSVDLQLFEHINYEAKIYYQIPEKDYEHFSERLNNILLDFIPVNVEVMPVFDLDQFYIPTIFFAP